MKPSFIFLRPDKAGDALKTLPALRALVALNRYDISVVASTFNASIFETEPSLSLFRLPPQWQTKTGLDIVSDLRHQGMPTDNEILFSPLCDRFDEMGPLIEAIPSKHKFSVPLSSAAHYEPLHFQAGTPARVSEKRNIAEILSQAVGQDLIPAIQSYSSAPVLDDLDRKEAQTEMDRFQGRTLGICPLAGTEQRSHSEKRFAAFFSFLSALPHYDYFFLFGTKKDEPWLRKTMPESPKFRILQPSSFRALGAYLERVQGVVAVDSGPLHLSLSLKIPSLGFLSGGDYQRWFDESGPQDVLVKRGLLTRHPLLWEMKRAFRQWESCQSALTQA